MDLRGRKFELHHVSWLHLQETGGDLVLSEDLSSQCSSWDGLMLPYQLRLTPLTCWRCLTTKGSPVQ